MSDSDLEIENALLRTYIYALQRNMGYGGIVVVDDEMIERTGRAAIEALYGQKLS